MIKTMLIGGALTLALAGAATAQMDPSPGMAAPNQGPPMTTPQYIMAASQSDEFEIQEGHMAASRAKNVDLQRFGSMMVSDHTKTTDTLHDAIRTAGMPVPPPPPLRPDQMQMVAELRQLQGRDFDKAYLAQQMQSHQEALMVQQTYASSGDVPPVRVAAVKAVPIVKLHISMLNQIQTAMGQ